MTAGPVGLLGVHTRITRVRSVIASSIPCRSWAPLGRFGICTLFAPSSPTRMGYASKERQAVYDFVLHAVGIDSGKRFENLVECTQASGACHDILGI